LTVIRYLLALRATILKELGKVSDADIQAVYHCVLGNETETRITRTAVKKGNRFTRIILGAFMMKTEKIVEGTECIEHPIPAKTRIDFKDNSIEVWVYGRIPCVQITASRVALRFGSQLRIYALDTPSKGLISD
jgi:hypothetical protein